MKVLQINALYGEKSTGIIVKDIADKLGENHGSPLVVCMKSTSKKEFIISTGGIISSNLHALLTRLFGFQGCWSYISTQRLLRCIKKLDPDIVHIHNLHSNFINLFLILNYCAKYNKPLIVTLHDCWYFTGKCYHFEDIRCNKWLTECENCPKRQKDIPSYLYDSSRKTFKIKYKAFNAINNLIVVGCSKWITYKAKSSPMFKNAEFYTIHNGVDTTIFHPVQKKKDISQPFTILVMANKWFLPENTALRDRLKRIACPKIQFYIIGCNEIQLKNNFNDQNIHYIGYIKNRTELADYYRKVNVFLNVTFIDTLPTVNMEAICCGTPVITYKSGGSPELVIEGKTGYVVDQNDIDGLIKAIFKVKNNNIDRTICANIGAHSFDKNLNYEKYITLYKNILSK